MSVLAPIHDFAAKLRQPSLLERLKDYVLWQAALRRGTKLDDPHSLPPDYAPVSINLDLTTACNYACDHCVDLDILNTGIRYDFENLKSSLDRLWQKGLRSVILIGGGEPTVFPQFEETVEFLKKRDIAVAIVSNGSGNAKILKVAHLFGPKDWVRLSLDSGSDETFQKMHKPKKPVTLDQICEGIPPIKAKNPNFQIGFSYIITWKGATANDFQIVENIGEIGMATERAKKYKFDYISMKPFLVRAEKNNAEIVGLDQDSHLQEITKKIRESVDEAKRHYDGDGFRVVESTNLRVLMTQTWSDFVRQPTQCHMTFFRQVLSPLGLFICPVYRHVPHAQLGSKAAFGTDLNYQETRHAMKERILSFHATEECKEVTCLYNPANWWIEDLIQHPERLESLEASAENFDFFL